MTWKDDVPIYRQVHERVASMILEGALAEGEALPSVRQVAAECQINPLTVTKAYQELVDEDLVEKRRGLGTFVVEGARQALLDTERRHFLETEWPATLQRIQQLGLDIGQLFEQAGQHKGDGP